TAEVEGQDVALGGRDGGVFLGARVLFFLGGRVLGGGRDVQELCFGVEPNDASNRRELAANCSGDLDHGGEPVHSGGSPLGWDPDGHSGGTGGASGCLTNRLLGRWLRRWCGGRPGPTAPERQAG